MTTRNEMCDAIGKAHEFLLCLKKAGMNDYMMQKIINSKNNNLAKKMIQAYHKEASKNYFELVTEFEFQSLNIKQSELIAFVRSICLQCDNLFDKRLDEFWDYNLLPDKKMKVSFYKPTEPVSSEAAKAFIQKKGNFPGFYGLASVWYSEYIYQKTNIPLSYQIFAYGDESKNICPVLTRFNKKQWHFSVKPNNSNYILSEKSLILVLREE